MKTNFRGRLMTLARNYTIRGMAMRISWRREWKRRFKKIRLFRIGYRSPTKIYLFRALAFFFLVVVVSGVLGFSVLFAWFARDLPRPDRVVRREGFAKQI